MPVQRNKVNVKDESKTPNAKGSSSSSSATPSPSREVITRLRCRLTALEADVERLGKLISQTAQSQPPRSHHDDKSHLRTVYLNNIEYGGTAAELDAHFAVFGPIHRIAMLYCSDGRPRGQAFVDFVSPASAGAALAYNGVPFRGRPLYVMPRSPRYSGGLRTRQYYSNSHHSYKAEAAATAAAATAWGAEPIGSGAIGTKMPNLTHWQAPAPPAFHHIGTNAPPGPIRTYQHYHHQQFGGTNARYRPY